MKEEPTEVIDPGKPDSADKCSISQWPVWAVDFAPRDAEHLPVLMARFIARLTTSAKQMIDGENVAEMSPAAAKTIRNDLGSIANSLDERRRLSRWWDMLIEAGNKTGRWKILFPPPQVPLPLPRTIFVRRDFQLVNKLRAIESEFLARLAQGTLGSEDLKDAWMLSAILFGGTITNERLRAVIAADFTKLRAENGLAWLPIELDSGKPSARIVTWYPDALTTTLYVKWRAIQPGDGEGETPAERQYSTASWNSMISSVLVRLDLPKWNCSTTEFLRAAEVSMRMELPGYEASYLADEIICHSLPEQVKARLAGWRIENPVPVDPEPDSQIQCDLQSVHTTFDKSLDVASQLKVLSSATKVMNSPETPISQLIEIQQSNGGKLWPITFILLEWAKWLLGPNSSQRRPVVRSTAKTYLEIIGKRLLMIIEDDEILDYEPADFETLYELAADRVRSKAQRARFWGRIRLFHDFLFLCGAPDMDLRELDGYVHGSGHRVSANILAESEFARFKVSLVDKIKATGSCELKMILLAGICGYRLGLRRRETQMIHLLDIHPGSQPSLLVRPSRLAALKTFSAQRQLPLAVLLPADELELFNMFVADRRSQDGEQPGLLFSDPGAQHTPLAVERIFNPLTAMFKAICGTQSGMFRFHHLRHSFANWLLIALLASDERDLLVRRPSFIESAMLDPEQLHLIRVGLFPRLAGTENPPGRRHLYQVAALMGHLSPETTLKCYLHLVDWLAGRRLDIALARTLKDWSPGQLGVFCGLSHAMAYRPPYRSLGGDPVGFLRQFSANRLPRPLQVRKDYEREHSDLNLVFETLRPIAIPRALTVMTLLQRYYSGSKVAWLSRVFAIPPSAINAAIEAYERLFAKQSTPKTKKSFKVPYEPRLLEDREEFWRILDASARSFEKPENRADMASALEALLRRKGPRTGNVRFWKNFESAGSVTRGLLCMGLSLEDLTLVISKHAGGSSIFKPTAGAINAVKRLGVPVREEVNTWEKRSIDQAHIRIEIDFTRQKTEEKQQWWLGRAAGLNYSSVWLASALQVVGDQAKSR